MGSFLNSMIDLAKADRQTIVLAEGDDPRTLQAAERILADGVADLIILGDVDAMTASSRNLAGARLMDPATSELRERFAEELFELRRAKGMTAKKAYETVADPLYFGVMLVKDGLADGMVAGACHSTGDVLRPSL